MKILKIFRPRREPVTLEPLNGWPLIFDNSRVNGAEYRGESLPERHWDWPTDTYLQKRRVQKVQPVADSFRSTGADASVQNVSNLGKRLERSERSKRLNGLNVAMPEHREGERLNSSGVNRSEAP